METKQQNAQQSEAAVSSPAMNHLPLAGASYVLGDAAMVGATLAHMKNGERGQWWNMLGAIGWSAGGLAVAMFGNPPKDRRAYIQGQRLATYLRRNDVRIPQSVLEQHPLYKERPTVFGKFTEFLYTYPSEVMNGTFALFSLGVIRRGVLAHTSDLQRHKGDLWRGIAVLAGAMFGLMVREDPDAERRAAQTGNPLEIASSWVKQQPLRVTSAMYLVSSAILTHRTMKDYNLAKQTGSNNRSYIFTGLGALGYFVGNLLLGQSSRDPTRRLPMSEEQKTQIKNLAAEIIAGQSKETRPRAEVLIKDYLARECGIGGDGKPDPQLEEEVVQAKQRRIDAVSERGWRTRREAERKTAAEQVHAPHL